MIIPFFLFIWATFCLFHSQKTGFSGFRFRSSHGQAALNACLPSFNRFAFKT
jgi:hypothetical protein